MTEHMELVLRSDPILRAMRFVKYLFGKHNPNPDEIQLRLYMSQREKLIKDLVRVNTKILNIIKNNIGSKPVSQVL